MQLEQRLAHIRFIPETQTNPLRKTDREAIADRNSSYTKKKTDLSIDYNPAILLMIVLRHLLKG